MTKQQLKLVSDIFFYPAVILMMARSFVERTGYPEAAETILWICFGLITAAAITRIIYWLAPKLRSKPTREEMEARNFPPSNAGTL